MTDRADGISIDAFEAREETPRGHGAVSVVRVLGPGALAAVRELAGGVEPRIGVPRLVRLRARGGEIGEGAALGGASGEREALGGASGERDALGGTSGEREALDGAHGERAALDGASGEREALDGASGERESLDGASGERESLDGASGEREALGGASGEREGLDIDEALVCARGREDVEVHVHASPVVVRALLAALAALEAGATRASERASDSATARARARDGGAAPLGSVRDVEARAWARLAEAPSEAGARILLDQAEGAWRRAVIAAAEGRLDEREFAAWQRRSHAARAALEPLRILIAGPVNAGKSTLFNALVGEERAITSAEEGTTRDLVRARGTVGAYPVEWIDSAGERERAADEVERLGIERARRAHADVDLVLWLVDAARATARDGAPHEGAGGAAPRVVTLLSRADRAPEVVARVAHLTAVSARSDPAHARAAVAALVLAHARLGPAPWESGMAAAFDPATRAFVDFLAAAAPSERAERARRHLAGP